LKGELMAKHNSSAVCRSRKKIVAALVIGLLLVAVVSPGVAVFLGPLGTTEPPWFVVASLDRVLSSGEPELFLVTPSQQDAWQKHEAEPIGAVYLRRLPESGQIVALDAVSPWLGCLLKYDVGRRCFFCTCHCHEDFDLDGRCLGSNPSPRDLDSLDVKVEGGDVIVRWHEPGENGLHRKSPRPIE
jgi:Rieske Fe-S protein